MPAANQPPPSKRKVIALALLAIFAVATAAQGQAPALGGPTTISSTALSIGGVEESYTGGAAGGYLHAKDGTFIIPPGTTTIGAAINAAIAACPTTGCRIETRDESATLETLVSVTGTNVHLDLTKTKLTAKNALGSSLIRLASCVNCTLELGFLDGNRAGQSTSSFCVDVNGGRGNRVLGGIVTGCETYGVYVIGADYTQIIGTRIDRTGQTGIAGDVGSSDVRGLLIDGVVVQNVGLDGTGALSGIHIEGSNSAGYFYRDVTIRGSTITGSAASGVSFQNVLGCTLSDLHIRNNGKDGISLASTKYCTGTNLNLDNNDQAAAAGYDNALAVDDTGVVPASLYNHFTNVMSRNHTGAAIKERGNPDYTVAWNVRSIGDGALKSLAGTNSRVITDPLETTWTAAVNGGGYALDNLGTVQGTTSADMAIYAKETRSLKLYTAGVSPGYSSTQRLAIAGGAATAVATWSSTEHQGLYVENVKYKSTSFGTCNAGTAGTVQYYAAGAGTADELKMCMKTAADAYSWQTIHTAA